MICVTHVIIVIVNDMADCCLTNLGCLQIPTTVVTEEGQPGAPGTSATVALGTVATGVPGTPVIITNTGVTASAAQFNFTIPRGDVGAPGTPGANTSSLLFSTEGINRTATGWGTLLGYGPSLTAGIMANTGDRVVFEAGVNHYFQFTNLPLQGKVMTAEIRLLLNGSSITLSVYPVVLENKLLAFKDEIGSGRFVVTVRKAAATRGQVSVTFLDTYGNVAVGYNPVDVTINFANAINVGLEGNISYSSGGSYVSCEDFSATLYSA